MEMDCHKIANIK